MQLLLKMSSYTDYLGDGGIAASPMNNSYSSAMSAVGTPNASSASSSKAVLAALRALQDKIRRLETERSQALDESAQLRSQLKNQEIEAAHFRDKEKYASDKASQEARNNYEKLRQEKLDAETRLVRLEEKNKESERQQEELSRRIQELEEEKARALIRQNEIHSNATHLDSQLEQALHRENDLSQTLLWETKRHEDEVAQLNQRVNALRNEISEASAEKNSTSTTLAELDQLVGQLLSVNESLVAKLSGKPMPAHTATLGVRKTTKKGGKVQYKDVLNATTAASSLLLPRAAHMATAASTASRAAPKVYGRAGQLAEQKNAEIEHLTSLHNMFSKLAKGITKKRLTKPATKSKAAVAAPIKASTGTKKTTRIGAKKASTKTSVSVDDSQLNTSSSSKLSTASAPKRKASMDSASANSVSGRNVYIPTASMSVLSPDNDSSPPSAYKSMGGSGGSRTGKIITSKNSNADDLQAVIASLEDEFDSLNNQYSYLLSSVKSQPGANLGASMDSTNSTGSANADTAEELVDVIQKLHRKGEQLRQLRSPSRNGSD